MAVLLNGTGPASFRPLHRWSHQCIIPKCISPTRRLPRVHAIPEPERFSTQAREALQQCLTFIQSNNLDGILDYLEDDAVYNAANVKDSV
jgi:hypothetical protein